VDVPAHDVKDLTLAAEGLRRIEWAERDMPVLRGIRERFAVEQPLAGFRVTACLHVTSETACLMRTLQAGGATVALCASNPLSTQDDVAAALVAECGVSVFAICGEDDDTYYRHINAAVDLRPHLTMDDGADVIGVIHATRRELLDSVIAGTEETTTGVIRLRAMQADGVLGFPVIAVNEAQTKRRWTASSAPPTCCWLAAPSWSPATAGVAAASPSGRGGWAPTCSSPRWIRCAPSRPPWTAFAWPPWRRLRRWATSSARRRAPSA
jgi:hypothetical protein